MIKTPLATEGLEPEDAEETQNTNAAVREHGYGGNDEVYAQVQQIKSHRN